MNTFGVAVDDALEKEGVEVEVVEGTKKFRDESCLEDEDWKKVESHHTKVDKDPDTVGRSRSTTDGRLDELIMC
jgi:hypothetical protein